MENEKLKNRTKEFAHRCVKLSMALLETALGKHVRRQLIRCSTSVASNYRAACIAQSKASFISKVKYCPGRNRRIIFLVGVHY
ncbi:MAG: four helix bundle protein [Thermodesulfobacteriota bacterium]